MSGKLSEVEGRIGTVHQLEAVITAMRGSAAATAGDSSRVNDPKPPIETVIKSTSGKSPRSTADSSKSFSPISCAVSDGGKSLA